MRIPLIYGAYQAKSIIAEAQRCVNLYPEINPKGAPSPVTHYQTPGLVLLATAPAAARVRGTYRATNGDLYLVSGNHCYFVDSNFNFTDLLTLTPGDNPVSMVDNGVTLILVDGTPNGWSIDLVTHLVTQIMDPNFFGADRADFVDTFFLFNKPNTPIFYASGSEAVTFNALDFAAKTGWADPIQSLIVMQRQIYLIGSLTSEVWYNAGTAPFTFAEMPGTFIEHGTVAKYSITKQDLQVFFLSQDLQGNGRVYAMEGFLPKAISTPAIEFEFSTYATLSDAIGFTYQQEGHVFYVLTFPTADKTWVYDVSTSLAGGYSAWHERQTLDGNGVPHRVRYQCAANAYGKIIVGDRDNGNLYSLDLNAFTDNGMPIECIRSFPHMMNDLNRGLYTRFVADMECGNDDGSVDGSSPQFPPLVYLRWSDDRGKTYGNKVGQSLGSAGQYLTNVQWRRLGYARDRVFELSWSAPAKTALNGAFFEMIPAAT